MESNCVEFVSEMQFNPVYSMLHIPLIEFVFLKQRYLGGILRAKRSLKDVTSVLVERVYGLQLQALVNYSGLKNKIGLKDFKSTEILLGRFQGAKHISCGIISKLIKTICYIYSCHKK